MSGFKSHLLFQVRELCRFLVPKVNQPGLKLCSFVYLETGAVCIRHELLVLRKGAAPTNQMAAAGRSQLRQSVAASLKCGGRPEWERTSRRKSLIWTGLLSVPKTERVRISVWTNLVINWWRFVTISCCNFRCFILLFLLLASLLRSQLIWRTFLIWYKTQIKTVSFWVLMFLVLLSWTCLIRGHIFFSHLTILPFYVIVLTILARILCTSTIFVAFPAEPCTNTFF